MQKKYERMIQKIKVAGGKPHSMLVYKVFYYANPWLGNSWHFQMCLLCIFICPVMHRWFTAIKSIYEVHKQAGKEPLYFWAHEWVQALILGYFNPLIWWITIPDITIKHLKMYMNGLGGPFSKSHAQLDWHKWASLPILNSFNKCFCCFYADLHFRQYFCLLTQPHSLRGNSWSLLLVNGYPLIDVIKLHLLLRFSFIYDS